MHVYSLKRIPYKSLYDKNWYFPTFIAINIVSNEKNIASNINGIVQLTTFCSSISQQSHAKIDVILSIIMNNSPFVCEMDNSFANNVEIEPLEDKRS